MTTTHASATITASTAATTSPSAALSETPTTEVTRIAKALSRKTFATLATVSPAGSPHSAGVVYVWAAASMWIHTMRTSRKGRNLEMQPRVAVTVPFRRMPAGPPFTLHFQGIADLVEMTDASVHPLLESGALKLIAGHDALDEPDGVFVRITPRGTIHSYGPGAKVIDLIRDPLHSGQGSARATDVIAAIR